MFIKPFDIFIISLFNVRYIGGGYLTFNLFIDNVYRFHEIKPCS